MRYAVVLHKDKGSVYGVTVPDLPGCFSAGDTIDEALENARAAIYTHLELLADYEEGLPELHGIDVHQSNSDYADGIFAVVEVDVDDIIGPAERINLTVPRRALAKIDAAARKLGDSRSGLMTKASIEYIAKAMPVRALVAARTKRAKPSKSRVS